MESLGLLALVWMLFMIICGVVLLAIEFLGLREYFHRMDNRRRRRLNVIGKSIGMRLTGLDKK